MIVDATLTESRLCVAYKRRRLELHRVILGQFPVLGSPLNLSLGLFSRYNVTGIVFNNRLGHLFHVFHNFLLLTLPGQRDLLLRSDHRIGLQGR